MGALGEQTDMKTLWILAAVATLAACHNRSEDEVGAAPDRGDTTAVTTDTTTTGGVTAQPGDTAAVVAPDTTTQYPAPPAADTTSAVPPAAPTDTTMAAPDAGVDTTAQPTPDATGYDTTGAPGVTPDTGMGAPLPSDSAAQSPSP